MRNAVALLLTLAMLATSAVIALDAIALQGSRAPFAALESPDGIEPDRARLIAAFYDAANTLLDGGRSLMLPTVISPELETLASAGVTSRGEAGLVQHLDGMRQRGPISLHLVRLIGHGSEVAAVVAVRGPAPSHPDGAVEPLPLLGQAIDRFRIVRGMVADYWPGAVERPPLPPWPWAPIRAPPGKAAVTLTRLELTSDAAPVSLGAPFPQLLLVESGVLAVSRDQAFSFARAGDLRFTTIAPDRHDEALLVRPGDTVLVPERTVQSVRNAGSASASALSLLVANQAALYGQNRMQPTDAVTIMGAHDPWRIDRRVEWNRQIATETLAVAPLPDNCRASAIALSGSSLTLEPNQSLPSLHSARLQLAIVRVGVVSVTAPVIAPLPGALARAFGQPTPGRDRLFWTGDAFSIAPGDAPELENPGPTRLDLLLVDIVPVDGAAASPVPCTTDRSNERIG